MLVNRQYYSKIYPKEIGGQKSIENWGTKSHNDENFKLKSGNEALCKGHVKIAWDTLTINNVIVINFLSILLASLPKNRVIFAQDKSHSKTRKLSLRHFLLPDFIDTSTLALALCIVQSKWCKLMWLIFSYNYITVPFFIVMILLFLLLHTIVTNDWIKNYFIAIYLSDIYGCRSLFSLLRCYLLYVLINENEVI